ncbi:MAG: hypothetical protein Q9216_005561 [Gyalolechia sp. 2 TL-2023]
MATSPRIESIRIRPPQGFPPHGDLSDTVCFRKQFITIKHPAYDKDENTLLTLYCPDGQDGGLHFGTVRIACGIIANNRFHGCISTTPDNSLPLRMGDDNILPPGIYYYHLPHPTTSLVPPVAADVQTQPASSSAHPRPYRYPVIPSFQHWSFPSRGTLPPAWEALRQSPALAQVDFTLGSENPSTTVTARDVTCRLSTYDLGCEKAHILPKHEVVWFTKNGLKMLPDDADINGFDTISTTANLMLLRADLHKIFDDKRFVIVPKQGRLVTHFLVPADKYVYMHHNSEIRPTGVAIDFFFARLAWAIFPMLGKRFLKFGESKLLTVSGSDIPFEVNIADCAQFFAKPTKSGNNSPEKPGSPSKRARPNTNNEDLDAKRQGKLSTDNQGDGDCRGFESTKRRKMDQDRNVHQDPNGEPCKSPSLPKWLQPTPEQAKFAAIKAHALHEERARSDKDGFWAKELLWHADNRFGPFSDSAEVRRAEALEGKEVVDPDDEIWRIPLSYD